MRPMTTTRIFLVAALLAGCGGPPKKHTLTMQEMIAADPLPLAKGAKWTYKVTVKRFDVDADKEVTRTLSWTTEVMDAKEANGVVAYRVKGWPSDLANDLEGNPVATERTLLRKDNSFLFAAADAGGEPTLHKAEGWFSWPVMDGQKICPSAEMAYCWQVAAVESGYTLSFFTGPDEQTFELEPGTGIARYHYAHHGTTNEIEARLVEYTKGRK